MPILNYTTQKSVSSSVSEIQKRLGEAGANYVNIGYENGSPSEVMFSIMYAGEMIHFRLPARWKGVQAVLEEQVSRKAYKTEKHARMVAWRILKDWIESQLALIEANLAEMPEVFLPYMVNEEGVTLFENFKGQRLLAD